MMKRYVSLAMFAIFLLSLGINLAIAHHWVAYSSHDALSAVETSIFQIHALFMTMILGGLFAKSPTDTRLPKILSFLAIGLCVAWAVFVTISWSGYPFTTTIAAVASGLDTNSKEASVFLAAVVTYLYGSSDGAHKPAVD